MGRQALAVMLCVAPLGAEAQLPYRLHARPAQVARAYPRLAELIERKRHYDPGLLFRHAMWARYIAS